MALVLVDSTYGALIELEDIAKSPESLARLVESQKELFHSQIDQLQKIVVTQCKLTGANPLAQEMAAGALSIKIGKRPRDLLNPKAVKYMQSIFSIKDTIGKKETREISALCGITVTQVRDYFSSQRSRVRKLVRLSHEKATECGASKATTDGCSISPNQSVPASKDIPVSTSDLTVVGDRAQNPVNSENVTSVYTQYPATPEKAIPVGTQLISNPSNFSSVCSQIPGNSGDVTTVCTQVPGYSGSITTVCTQVPGNLVNATPISMSPPGNSGNITTVFTPILGYSGIVPAVGTLVPGSCMNIAPVQDGRLGPMKTNPKPVEEDPSCSLQDETSPCVDSDDKKFLENIFNLMRKEETFSGRVKLMEWVLQIHNSAVLSWFSTKGGITILATWLSEAATEEQTTVLLVIFKVLCHLPLSKAQPEQMSAILQTVNRLRFYRSSDISNRAKVLLSRWSKMFVRSQALRNSRKFLKNGQKEMIHKQRTNEVLGDESWESKLGIPDEFLALTESAEDGREAEPKKALKLLTDSSDGSARKHGRSVSATKTKERRKVLLVERPDSKAGRSTPGSRAVPSNHSRPMSADDIQKAKMRAIYMQDKYGKSNAPASENSPQKTEDLKPPPVSQVPANKIPQLPQPKRNEVKKSPLLPTGKSLSHKPETSTSSNPKLNLTTQEQLLEKLKKGQVPWRSPPEVRMNSSWRVGAGENSKEVQVQTQRNKREKETFYPNPKDIPPNPKEPWDVEMDFDDSLTPEIPIEQPPDLESPVATSAEAPLCSFTDDRAENVAPVVTSSAAITETVFPPATTSNGIPEPDTELLMVLLKNPDVVEALTRGEGRNLTEEQLVALLDMVKQAGTGVTGILDGLAKGSGARPREPEPEPFSLPSPTPPNATRTGWRSEFPSHASTSAPPSQFSGNRQGAPVVPPLVMPMGVNNQSAAPMAVNNLTRLQSQSQLSVTINPPTHHHQPVPNLYPVKLPPMYPPPVQQSRALETIIPSNHFPVNHHSLRPLHPGPLKPPPPPPIHSEPAVFIPKTPAWPPADPMPEYWNGRPNGVVDDPATNSNYYVNHNNYNQNSHHNMYPRRNEYVPPRPGMGTWSPEDSPVVSPPEFREFPYDRRDYSEPRRGDQSNEWSRQRQWSSGHQGQYRGGGGGGGGGDRRWQDCDRGG